MNRRGFLGALLGAFVADPEELLWVPGKKLISIPAPAIYRGNLLLTPEQVSRDMLRILQKNLVFHKEAFRLSYPAIGSTLNVRRPLNYVTH
jgi:hypothetical protein